MTWVHVALAVLVTIIVLVIAVSRSYALGRESGERDTLAGQGSDSGSLFGTDVPVREAEQGLIDVMPSEVIVCDGNGSVRCSSKSQVNVDVIENGWIVKDEILDILHVVVENGGVREREMCVSLDLTRMSSAISGRGVTAGSSAPSDSYLRVRVGHICDGLYAVFINDVTEQRRFERMRRDFVTNVSHELKTPLASIRLLADSILQNETMDQVTLRDFVSDIGTEADRLTRITEHLLALTRLDSLPAAETFPVDVSAVTRRALSMLAPVADAAGVALGSNLKDKCVVQGTEDDLYQICFNLLENGIKYNRPGGRVMADVYRDGDQVLLEVSDTGVGIPEEDMPKVFNRFYRVDKARSRAAGGTGLGLSIVRDTVRRHGGWVTVRARQPEGSVFTVGFPAVPEKRKEGDRG